MQLLLVAAMFLVPLLGGIVLGFVQLGVYRLLRRSPENVPSFPILFARGMLAVVALAIGLAVLTRVIGGSAGAGAPAGDVRQR